MRKFGLIGHPLGHSFSASYFAAKFEALGCSGECLYLNFDLEHIEQIRDVLEQNPELEGFNVTIPYKEQILPYLDTISDEAARIGAVNCVKVESGKLHGYNTDLYGAGVTIDRLTGGKPYKALVLGSGGASKAVREALRIRGIEYTLVSRKHSAEAIAYEELSEEIIASHKLIINTTPLGMYPKVEGAPDIPYSCLTAEHRLFDIVYNPAVTRFMAMGAEHGATVVCGEEMLREQAEKSWVIWNI
jgi:shikimate dehydrogenase